MNEYTVIFREGLSTGLRPNKRTAKNLQSLIRSDSAFPDMGILRSTDDLESFDLSALDCGFPFPQIFQLRRFTLICTADSIYKYNGGLELVFTGEEGTTWTVADFDTFLVFTNGRSMATLDPISGVWSTFLFGVPHNLCVCDVNGQLLVGGPDVTVTTGMFE